MSIDAKSILHKILIPAFIVDQNNSLIESNAAFSDFIQSNETSNFFFQSSKDDPSAFNQETECIQFKNIIEFLKFIDTDVVKNLTYYEAELELVNLQKVSKIVSCEIYLLSTEVSTQENLQIPKKLVLIKDKTESLKKDQAKIHAQKMNALIELSQKISHDFKSMLGLVLGHCSILQHLSNHEFEKNQFHTQKIKDAVQRSLNLMEHKLDFGSFSKYAPELIDIEIFLQQIVEKWNGEHSETNSKISFTSYLNKDNKKFLRNLNIKNPVTIDPTIIEKVFIHLFTNAYEAINIKTDPQINLSLHFTPESGSYLISLEDHGVGIDSDIQFKIFEPFYTTKSGSGNGLGLTYVYGALKLHKGAIDIESVKGEYTRVHLVLPKTPEISLIC